MIKLLTCVLFACAVTACGQVATSEKTEVEAAPPERVCEYMNIDIDMDYADGQIYTSQYWECNDGCRLYKDVNDLTHTELKCD